MKKYYVFMLIMLGMFLFGSCKPSTPTGSDTYDPLWSPAGNSKNTSWVTTSGGSFTQIDGGFQYIATLVDTIAGRYSFSVTPYVITNISSGQNANLSFTARVVPDSVQLKDLSYAAWRFGDVSGTVTTTGADTSMHSIKAFFGEITNSYPLSISPDSCSKNIKFDVVLRWRNFAAAGTPSNPIPHSRLVTIEISNLTMSVTGVSVLK
jgi:hypothetical protein